MDVRSLLTSPERLELVAQPIVDVRRGSVVGYEALARFKLDVRASPDVVFTEAVRQGLGVQLEAVVVRRALELAARKPLNCFLSINVDPAHLVAPEVLAALAEPATLGGIVLELTEHRAIDDADALLKALEALRKRGALIAVDDAGSGYSGLQQILMLRPQILKVDRALITNVHEDDAKAALVQMLGEFAARLDAWVLAEGVETESEMSVLRQLGVPLAQGYYLARPAPPWADVGDDARAFLDQAPMSVRRARVVRRLLEPCTTCGLHDGWANENIVVRVTEEGRPVGMRFVHAGEPSTRDEHELMRVKGETALETVAQRAVTRPERLRWDPLVCIDEAGHFRGIIRMSRLVSAIAEEGNRPSMRPTVN